MFSLFKYFLVQNSKVKDLRIFFLSRKSKPFFGPFIILSIITILIIIIPIFIIILIFIRFILFLEEFQDVG